MLGDVGDPDQVRCARAELALEQVIVHRRTGPAGLATSPLPSGGRPQPLLRTQPPDPPLTSLLAGAFELVGQESVAELRVIAVRIDQRVDRVRVGPRGPGNSASRNGDTSQQEDRFRGRHGLTINSGPAYGGQNVPVTVPRTFLTIYS